MFFFSHDVIVAPWPPVWGCGVPLVGHALWGVVGWGLILRVGKGARPVCLPWWVGAGVVVFRMESLILAQDERWRRA